MYIQTTFSRWARSIGGMKGPNALALSLLIVLATACASSAPPAQPAAPTAKPAAESKPAAPTATTVPAKAPPKTTEKVSLRLDFLPTGYHSAFYVAIDKGWYQERGLEVTIGDGKGSASTVQLVATGQDTFGLAALDRVIVAAAQGAPVVAVADPVQESGACFVALADSGIKSFKDLEGKSVTTSAGGFVLGLMPAVFKAAGVDASKVNIVNMEPSAQVPALLQRKIDAYASVCGDSTVKMEATGTKLNTLLFADAGVATLGSGILTNSKTLQEKPDMVKAFVEASLKGWQYMLEQPDEAAAILKRRNADAPVEAVSVQIIRNYAKRAHTDASKGKPLGWMAEKDWQTTTDLLVQYADLKGAGSLDVTKFFTNRFIPGS